MGKLVQFTKDSTPVVATLVDQFLADLKSENKSAHTLKNYRADLQAFLRFYQGELSALSAAVLRDYFTKELAKASPGTQARKRASLKSFLRWCFQQDLIVSNPMDKIGSVKLPEAQPRFLPLGDVNKILKVIEDDRDRVLFTLLSETGLRISEALGLRVQDLRLESKELRVSGKGQRERTIHLVKTESLRLLGWYLRKYDIRDGLVFRPDSAKQRHGASDKPIDYSVVAKAWKRYCLEAGISCTIHQLRHSHATDLINRGASVEVVSKLLGHKNLQTTMRYAVVSDRSVKETLEKVR